MSACHNHFMRWTSFRLDAMTLKSFPIITFTLNECLATLLRLNVSQKHAEKNELIRGNRNQKKGTGSLIIIWSTTQTRLLKAHQLSEGLSQWLSCETEAGDSGKLCFFVFLTDSSYIWLYHFLFRQRRSYTPSGFVTKDGTAAHLSQTWWQVKK